MAFCNERENFKKHVEEIDESLSEIPKGVYNMYEEVFRWGLSMLTYPLSAPCW